MTLSQKLSDRGLSLAVAESLTAGLVCAELASTPGASKFLLGGVVCYQDDVKIQQLGVSADLLAKRTAIDSEVAMQLALGVRANFAADCSRGVNQVIGISTTGVAGPDPVGDKPVGLVYIGIASAFGVRAVALNLSGSRSEIRAATVSWALSAIEDEIQSLLG